MTTDLFAEDPALLRIAELEKQNAELKAACQRMIDAWGAIRPSLNAVHKAMEELGESQYLAGELLRSMEAGHAAGHPAPGL